ncbi:nuclear cap-binding protein subunit 3, partial [Biomphalaria glabrata]
MATRKNLPNLKICVDNTDSTDESDVEIQGSDSSSSSDDHVIKVESVRQKNKLDGGEEDDVLSITLDDKPTERRFLSRSVLNSKKLPAYAASYG